MYNDYGDDDFADPGGRSALRAGERTEPCPKRDVQLGYQCDECADRAEGWGG